MRRILVSTLLLTFVGHAHGQAAPLATEASAEASARTLPEAARSGDGVHFRFTADAWFPRLDADLASGAGAPALDAGEFELDGTEATFDGEFEFRADIWHAWLSGFDFSTDGRATADSAFTFGGLAVPAGTSLDASFDMASVAFEAGISLYRPFADRPWPWSEGSVRRDNMTAEGEYRADLRFIPYVGGRWIGLENELQALGIGDSRFDSDWFAIYGGLGLELEFRVRDAVPFVDRFVLGGRAAGGGIVAGGSGTMFTVRAGLDIYFLRNAALSIGYQLLYLDGDESDWSIDGGPQGLWVGGTVWF